MYKLLHTIDSPADLKALSLAQLEQLAAEMREALRSDVSHLRRFADALDLILREPPFPDALELTAVGTRLRAADPAMQWFRRVLREEAAAVYGERAPVAAPRERGRDRAGWHPIPAGRETT